MIFEIAEFQVKDGMQDAFIRGTTESRPIFEQVPGFKGLALHQDIDDPLKFIILVRWDSVQHHLDLQKTDLRRQIREKVIECFSALPNIRYTHVKVEY